jgi:hypothetical protein
MAYVVKKASGRFEIRESRLTENGPRSRTLVTFKVLTQDSLKLLKTRSKRPYSETKLIKQAIQKGAPVSFIESQSKSISDTYKHFLKASKNMSSSIKATKSTRPKSPDTVLIELLRFVDTLNKTQNRPFDRKLKYPILTKLKPH